MRPEVPTEQAAEDLPATPPGWGQWMSDQLAMLIDRQALEREDIERVIRREAVLQQKMRKRGGKRPSG